MLALRLPKIRGRSAKSRRTGCSGGVPHKRIRQQEAADGDDVPELRALRLGTREEVLEVRIADLAQAAMLDERAGVLEMQAESTQTPKQAGLGGQAPIGDAMLHAAAHQAAGPAEPQEGQKQETAR